MSEPPKRTFNANRTARNEASESAEVSEPKAPRRKPFNNRRESSGAGRKSSERKSLGSKAADSKPPIWLQALKVIAGILLMNVLTYSCFTVSYTVVGFVKEKQGHAAVTKQLLEDGHLIAAAFDGKPTASGMPEMLTAFSNDRHYTLTFTAANSGAVYAPEDPDAAVQTSKIKPEDVEQVLAGAEVKEVFRKYPYSQGTVLAGVPLTVGGVHYGLFLEEKAPSLYQGFWQQVLIVFYGFLLMFVIMLLVGRPWRESGIYVYITAIRRMSKGDFTVTIDKTERGHFGELAASINDMAVELNQMEQMRQAFISNVSHEIQSPLTSIRGFARALQQDGTDDQQRQHYAGIIEAESIRLSKLSDNLMKLTTLEADQQQLHPKPFRLDQQVRAMILACEPIWSERNILMDVNLEDRVLLTGDEELLSQVWMNILTNSLKYTSEGGIVSVEAKRTKEGAVVVISDNGIGIDEADLPHIFERFFKADKSRSRRQQGNGSGLGLSIVKVIVDMHGGQVKASSKPGVGTTITVKLPNLPVSSEQ